MDTEVTMINNVISMADTQEPTKTTGLGERLKSARNAMHLSEKEAAARLYLNVKIITIMENENFAEGPPATFMRGYLHSYARLLDFPESEINAALKELEVTLPTSRPEPPVMVKQNPANQTDRYLRWITLGIAVILFLLVSIWWRSHSNYDIADVPTTTSATSAEKAELPVPAKDTTQPKIIAPPPPELLAAPKPTPPPLLQPLKSTPSAAIPLAPTASQAVNSKKSTVSKKKTKHQTRHSRVQNMDMALPEPGYDSGWD